MKTPEHYERIAITRFAIGQAYWFNEKELAEYKEAIKNQLVIDKLPDSEIKSLASRYDFDLQCTIVCAMKEYRDELNQRLTTRAEVEHPFRQLLKESMLQLEYLNEKFSETGTTNNLLIRMQDFLNK